MAEYKSEFYKEIIGSFLQNIKEEKIIKDEAKLTALKNLFELKEVPSMTEIKEVLFDEKDIT